MVYEPSSGLYFDYKSGYYFDADRSLYYDGNSGTYYSYNYETKSYEVHSQVEMKAEKKTKKRTNDENKELKCSSFIQFDLIFHSESNKIEQFSR